MTLVKQNFVSQWEYKSYRSHCNRHKIIAKKQHYFNSNQNVKNSIKITCVIINRVLINGCSNRAQRIESQIFSDHVHSGTAVIGQIINEKFSTFAKIIAGIHINI